MKTKTILIILGICAVIWGGIGLYQSKSVSMGTEQNWAVYRDGIDDITFKFPTDWILNRNERGISNPINLYPILNKESIEPGGLTITTQTPPDIDKYIRSESRKFEYASQPDMGQIYFSAQGKWIYASCGWYKETYKGDVKKICEQILSTVERTQ
jgi:hypothetical protein